MQPDWIGSDSYLAFGGVMLVLAVITLIFGSIYDRVRGKA
jgi:hypothetical protein